MRKFAPAKIDYHNSFMKHAIKLFTLGFLSIFMGACNNKDNDAKERVCEVYHNVFLFAPETAGIGETVKSFPATVEEARNISVAFKTGGQIVRLYAREGDNVKEGQLLAMLDTADYALGVRQLRVQLEQLKGEFKRQTQLHAAGNMSDNDYEKAAAGVRQLELQLQLNENKLRYCHLYAPTSGVITRRNFETAEMVDAGRPVFELMDNNHMEVNVDLPVNFYMHHDEFSGFSGHVSHADAEKIPLKLLSITPKADNNQLYRMKLMMGKGTQGITPGMNLIVDVTMAGSDTSVADVPLSSILEKDGRAGVWTFSEADSTINFTPVEIAGTARGGMVSISDGLQPGKRIVRSGVHHLSEGEKVRVIAEPSSTNPGNLL